MKRLSFLTIPFVFIMLTVGCSSSKKHHSSAMPDPQSFNAHFGDMEGDGDDLVSWDEFSANFQNAEQKVFNAIDLNQDGNIDHDEWHEFKAAHGLKHIE